jgi:hypothetical protein
MGFVGLDLPDRIAMAQDLLHPPLFETRKVGCFQRPHLELQAAEV